MEKISDFLTEDINLEDLLLSDINLSNANNLDIKNNTTPIRAAYAAHYTNTYYDSGSYSAYAAYHNYNAYGNLNYYEYNAYAAYTNTYYNYGNYGDYSDYSNYSNYDNYCQVNCQICNVCQTKCQINLYVSYWLGRSFSYTPTNLLYILAADINDLINYITSAKNKINTDLTRYSISSCKITADPGNTVTVSDIYYHNTFNAINNAIKAFIDGNTNIATKNRTDEILKSNMETLKNTLNLIKIPATIPCCLTSGYETCTTRLD